VSADAFAVAPIDASGFAADVAELPIVFDAFATRAVALDRPAAVSSTVVIRTMPS
jgi:hypothetical protein